MLSLMGILTQQHARFITEYDNRKENDKSTGQRHRAVISCVETGLGTMRKIFSPLRYPGGKSKLAPFVEKILKDNNLVGGFLC